ncbi:hypothetical protein BZG79_04820 [Salinivibrio sp. MA427]|uniref:(2Fe-2S)-binding protein n=1 Tax=Salinivibrio sp. MA427 TaxID=1909455 RepID=UPI00098B0862|nr:(2Fe-2S)-binding protein [Salinivibrio sp. MA427]OOF17175.1 hypothetical protein BZG79_04820 [Salinivibrio sp. MA427]
MSAANPTVDALPLPATVTLPSFPPALGLSMVPDAMKGVSLRKQLTTAQGLAHCFSAVNATYGDADSRAQGTLFIGAYAYEFLLPVLASWLQGGQIPSLDLDNWKVKYEPTRVTKPNGQELVYHKPHFYLSALEGWRRQDHQDWRAILHGALLHHFSPIVDAIAEQSGMREGPLWKVIADSICIAFLMVGKHRDCEQAAREAALSIVHQRGTPLYSKRSGFHDVTVYDPNDTQTVLQTHSFRLRGGCCRIFTIDDHSYCSTCCFLKPDEQAKRLAEVACQREGVALDSQPR